MMKKYRDIYSVVDLFAGAGGLSLGFTQTQGFSVKVAAENNKYAQTTYRKNFECVELYDDVRNIKYKEILEKYGKIDVVIGGPPCQGFSNSNRQHNHLISGNNQLVKEFVRAITELKPDVFVMENVKMLSSDVHRFYYSVYDRDIVKIDENLFKADTLETLQEGIIGTENELREIECGIADKNFIWNKDGYHAVNVLYRQRNNSNKLYGALKKYEKILRVFCKDVRAKECASKFVNSVNLEMIQAIENCFENQSPDLCKLIEKIKKPFFFQKFAQTVQEINEYGIILEGGFVFEKGTVIAKAKSCSVFDYLTSVLNDCCDRSYEVSQNFVNAVDFGAPQKRNRCVLIGAKHKKITLNRTYSEKKYRTVRNAIADLQSVMPNTEVSDEPIELSRDKIYSKKDFPLSELRDSRKLYNHTITETRQVALERFKALKEGGNFHSLPEKLKATYTDAKRTQNTIYLRLKYDEPCGTVVNVRKSMWVHPVQDRAISIREAARLQTFPDSFIFTGTKDSQYQQVGNAVPPILARAIAKEVLQYLKDNKEKSS